MIEGLANHPFWLGVLGSTAAGACTAVGAAGVFAIQRLSPKLEDVLLSAAAGIMLAASFFSLILPGLEMAAATTGSETAASLIVIGGILLGAIGLWLLHEHVPHEHFVMGREGPNQLEIKRIWLFVIAITLHNLPEGMAVGVGFATGDPGNGMGLAVGIGMQNIPEGLAVAVSLLAIGYTRAAACAWGALTGLAEPLGGLIGAAAGSLAELALPAVLGAAAGAMLYIISDEIIPETHRRGFETPATFALMTGMVVMMFLDTTLG